MPYHATFDAEGLPTGYWQDGTAVAPDGAVSITDDQHEDLVLNAGLRRWDGKDVVAYTPLMPLVDLKAYTAAVRYAREIAGITVSGVEVATDDGSQAKIGNAYVLLQASGAASIEFKGSDGTFATLSADQFKTLALAVGAHVQGCFAAEGQVVSAIAAGTIKTMTDVDAAFAAMTA